MRFVSPLLRRVVYPAMHYGGWIKRSIGAGGCLIANYHGVIPPGGYSRDPFLDANLLSAAALQGQLRFLKTDYNIVAPETFRAWMNDGGDLPPRSVLVTCDDGLVNNVSDMLPVLKKEGVSCLFFVTGESCREHPGMLWYEDVYHLLKPVGLRDEDVQAIFEIDAAHLKGHDFQAKWWNCVLHASQMTAPVRAKKIEALRTLRRGNAPPLAEGRFMRMNFQQLQLLASAGMSIGAHTMSHPVLAQCTEDEARREIHESKSELERVLGQTVWAFAYPFGNPATMGEREVRLARNAGFECAFVNVGGGAIDRTQPFLLARTHVTADMSLAEFEAHLSGFHSRLQAAVRG
jgi:peptidoglycan/xylan/chitin deacetylase (PgdA/CDA1 family)